MAVITALTESPRAPGRYVVLADGEELATVSVDIVDRLRLRVGKSLEGAEREAVLREAAVLGTYDRAARMLAVRARSADELRRRLVRKGEPTEQVNAALSRLSANGVLNDADFARQFARAKTVGAGLARRRLQQELARRGVARDVASGALDEVLADESLDEAAILEDTAARRLEKLRGLEPLVRRRRLYSFLARRGYGSDAIARVLSRILPEGSDEQVD